MAILKFWGDNYNFTGLSIKFNTNFNLIQYPFANARLMKIGIFLTSFFFIFNFNIAQNLSLQNLRCEYKTNPVGIDEMQPRFSWELQSDQRDVMQTAYQIKVAKSQSDLEKDKNLVWDSGKINSDQSIHVEYAGEKLESRQRYFWQVEVWDNKGNSTTFKEPPYWEMALLSPTEWQAKWVEVVWPEDTAVSQPVQLFRKAFDVKKKIKKARVYVTARGLYEASINGKNITEDIFTPGWTSYNKRLQYQTYDVTDQLNKGENAIAVKLGDGWYRGNMGFFGERNQYGKTTSLLLQLEVLYENGKSETIISDPSWKTATGPYIWSDIYNGEIYDANLEKEGWELASFDDSAWKNAKEAKASPAKLFAPPGPPVRRIEILKPQKLITTPKGETVLDFGQNMVGRVRFKVKGNKGDTLKIYHAEVLDKEGNFYTENLRAAKQMVHYICGEKSGHFYEPTFTFMGFRYIKLEGFSNDLNLDDFEGIVIHSDMMPAGDFECSDPLINQLQHNIQWGQKGNFLDVPTDCPQRDERMGWTGDAQAFSRTAAFNMDVASFFTKWNGDFTADQREDGMIPFVIPNVLGKDAGAATGWADAVTIIPWNNYLAFGDKRILERQYETMKGWVRYMEENAGDDFLWNTGFHFGDWLFYSVNDDRDGKSAITNKYFLAQAFFAHSTELVIKTAEVLGKTEDVKYYKNLHEKVKKAFLDEYVSPNGRIGSGTQTSYVLALEFGLLPEDKRVLGAKRLVDNIELYEDHITTGFLGTPHICHVLTNYGYLEKAYALLEQKTYPSWLYPVTKGATTIWERWDGIMPNGDLQNKTMNSFNHYAYGAIGDWLYRVVAGIDIDEENPGYKNVIIAPKPGGTLTAAKANHHSMFGTIESSWVIENDQFKLNIVVPPNTTAKVILPNADLQKVKESGQVLKKGNGIHDFVQNGENVEINLGSGAYFFSYPSTNN